MKNRFFRWCINWWASEQTPKWLRSALDRDSTLVEYQEGLDSLCRLLGEDAGPWAEREKRPTNSTERLSPIMQLGESTDARIRLATIAVLAASIVVVILLWNADALTNPVVRLPADKQIASADARQLSVGVKSIISAVDNSLTEIADSVSSVPEFAGDAVATTSSDVEAICDSAKAKFESVSRSFGQALALIEESARDQLGGIDTREH